MALIFSSWLTEFYFAVLLVFLFFYLRFKLFTSKYWKNRNVVHLEPFFILGNAWHASIKENFCFILSDIHRKWKDHKLVGFWNFMTPFVLVSDIELVKNVLAKDFNHFRDRGMSIDFDHDVLAGNLFNVGGTKWRNLRVKLTPTFTSGKMKMMFPTIVECGQELQEVLLKVSEKKDGEEVKEILARFTTDIIGTCAFGIQTNSLKNPDSEFRKYGKKIFEPDLKGVVKGILFTVSPFVFNILKLKLTPSDVSDFFINAVWDTIAQREKNKIKRNDFMELLIQLKNKGRLEDVDGVIPTVPSEDITSTPDDNKFTLNDAAAQAFVFFAAGFETSSTTMTFALYELALNTDIQTKLQDEIDRALDKHEGKLSYEWVMNLEYLDRVIQETLRKYPPVPFLFRECNKDYEIPELNVTIPNKTPVMISVVGIHWDPEHYPSPQRFDPDRFSPEEKMKRHHFAHLPFGEGPRNCIGSRFGLMQTKVGLISILSKFTVEVTNETPIPLHFDKLSFVLSCDTPMKLRFRKRFL